MKSTLPASLPRRVLAFAIDYVAISAYLLALTCVFLIIGLATPVLLETMFGQRFLAQVSGFLLVTLPVTLYFVLQEGSRWQATWGKRKMGLMVAGPSGGSISPTRSAARTLLKFVPWELAHTFVWQAYFSPDQTVAITVGFIGVWGMAGLYLTSLMLSRSKRTIYDRVSGTTVVRIVYSWPLEKEGVMSVRRIVPNVRSERFEESLEFYTEFLGLKAWTDLGWIATCSSPGNPTAQISLLRGDAPQDPHPDLSIEVLDVEQTYAEAQRRGLSIVYPLTDEPWGVRRFFVEDPNGLVLNILAHL